MSLEDDLAPPAQQVPQLMAVNPEDCSEELLARLLRYRHEFGVTRISTLGGLDRSRLCVCQAATPLRLSNAVTLGKGLSLSQAAISALMEALELWAAERIPPHRLSRRTMAVRRGVMNALYAGLLVRYPPPGWQRKVLDWIEGWDLLTERVVPVPAALVDTCYVVPGRHPPMFPRITTGLAAGRSMRHATIKAGLEILERDAVAAAQRMGGFFERHQLARIPASLADASTVLERMHARSLLAGIWRVSAQHDLPIYCCHVMSAHDDPQELAPHPAEGFGCDFTHDAALTQALLEAGQARLAAISGTREDIGRACYQDPSFPEQAAAWRARLAVTEVCPYLDPPVEAAGGDLLNKVINALKSAGAQAVLAVPLLASQRLGAYVVRLVAPPLRLMPEG